MNLAYLASPTPHRIRLGVLADVYDEIVVVWHLTATGVHPAGVGGFGSQGGLRPPKSGIRPPLRCGLKRARLAALVSPMSHRARLGVLAGVYDKIVVVWHLPATGVHPQG